MDEQTKLADLTVAQFRTLMQECFDADRAAMKKRKEIEDAVSHHWRLYGSPPPQPWDDWYREQRVRVGFGLAGFAKGS